LGVRLAADSLGDALQPRNGGDVYRYRLHSPDVEDLGESTYYAITIKPREEIHANDRERLRVVVVVPFDEEAESPFAGLLQVEAA
jgi:hypothetical protein